MIARQERRALLPHQTPLSLAPGEPHAAHLPPPLIRLLPQIDTGQREASYEIACGVGREDDEGGKNEIKALAAPEAAKWAALVAASVAPVRSNVEPLHFPPKYSTKLSSPVPVAGS